MWGKLLTVLVVTGIIGAVTFLGWRVVVAYGDARYSAGKADAKLEQMPAIIAANEAAAKQAIAGITDELTAERTHSATVERLAGLIATQEEKVDAYAQTDAGRAACLAPDRVRDIEADRAALFPPAAPATAAGGGPRPLPADLLGQAAGWKPEQR
jgi:hypothetical protein